MTPDTQTKKKPGILDKLPKLGGTSKLIIFAGLFLIILISLVIINLQQTQVQSQVKKDITSIQNVLATPVTQKADLEAEIKRTESDKLILISRFAGEGSSSLIAEQLMDLAKRYSINIGKLQISSARVSMFPSQNATKAVEYPVFSITFTMQGQVAQFSNFLIALDAIPSAKISSLDIRLAQNKGEDDSAIVKLDVLIYK